MVRINPIFTVLIAQLFHTRALQGLISTVKVAIKDHEPPSCGGCRVGLSVFLGSGFRV